MGMCVEWGEEREVVIREEDEQRIEEGESMEGSPFTLYVYLLRAT